MMCVVMLFWEGTHIAGAEPIPPASDLPLRIDGDIGAAAYYTRSIVRDKSEPATVLPYGYFDYGRAFLRIDTFGIKTARIGYGYLELAGRVTLDGFKTDTAGLHGLGNRQNSMPLGMGTFQETPIGGFFLNAFHDINQSRGNSYEAIWAGEWQHSPFTRSLALSIFRRNMSVTTMAYPSPKRPPAALRPTSPVELSIPSSQYSSIPTSTTITT